MSAAWHGSLAAILAARAADPRDTWSIRFLDSTGEVTDHLNARQLAARAAAVAQALEHTSAPGAPVLLVFQPGLDFLVAFMACIWSGRLAVPINPPRRHRLIARLRAVAADSGARVALTGGGLVDALAAWRADDGVLGALACQDVADLAPASADGAPPRAVDPHSICFLQYTSGSTALPKGVEVSHANLMADMARMAQVWGITPRSTLVTWLPAFHDLGLIFGLLQSVFSGCATIQMAPNSFLQRPGLWLEAISRFRGTHTAAPNFAYDLCARRIALDQRARLDLSSLVMAMNAAEPIDPLVMEAFVTAFGPHGFSHTTFCPAYGLAESTLAVTASPVGRAPRLFRLDGAQLEQGRIREQAQDGPKTRLLAGCGAPLPDVSLAIVDPRTRQRLPPDQIGEIWVGGPTIARGYWRRPDESRETFGVRIEGSHEPGSYLRTGDLGALIGDELCVTGRIKDLIILNGANHYPQDIERVAQASHPALRVGGGAAFSLVGAAGGEQVVLVQEVERTFRRTDPAPLFSAISADIWRDLELKVSHILLVEPGAVPRTSSGKIQRAASRQAWLAGELALLASWSSADLSSGQAGAPLGDESGAEALERWLREWLAARLGLPAPAIPSDRGLAELSLTSIDAVDLAAALGAHLDRRVPETLAFDYPTLRSILAHLSGAAAPTVMPPKARGGDIEDVLSMIEGGWRGGD